MRDSLEPAGGSHNYTAITCRSGTLQPSLPDKGTRSSGTQTELPRGPASTALCRFAFLSFVLALARACGERRASRERQRGHLAVPSAHTHLSPWPSIRFRFSWGPPSSIGRRQHALLSACSTGRLLDCGPSDEEGLTAKIDLCRLWRRSWKEEGSSEPKEQSCCSSSPSSSPIGPGQQRLPSCMAAPLPCKGKDEKPGESSSRQKREETNTMALKREEGVRKRQGCRRDRSPSLNWKQTLPSSSPHL